MNHRKFPTGTVFGKHGDKPHGCPRLLLLVAVDGDGKKVFVTFPLQNVVTPPDPDFHEAQRLKDPNHLFAGHARHSRRPIG
jgi:hypothetical protein